MRGLFAFNGCVDHQKFIAQKLKDFKIKVAIETGTLHGWTTDFLCEYVDEVHTIDVRPEPLKKADQVLEGRTNVHIYCANSVDILPTILSTIPADFPVFFYLDAHWQDYWPLFDELKIIGEIIGKRSVIVIDDFKVPNKKYAYDTYNCIENSMDSIGQYLPLIYKNGYNFEYLEGPENFEMILDENSLRKIEQDIYKNWYKGKIKHTTGKVIIYDKCQ